MTDKPLFDYDAMDARGRAAMWPDLRRFCDNPCDAAGREAVHKAYYDEETRREHYKRRRAKQSLRRDLGLESELR